MGVNGSNEVDFSRARHHYRDELLWEEVGCESCHQREVARAGLLHVRATPVSSCISRSSGEHASREIAMCNLTGDYPGR